MEKIRLTKIFTFETAHALYGHDGKCKNIHGHSYKFHVTIEGYPLNEPNHPKNGMVMDFGDLKSIVNSEIVSKLDHALLLNSTTMHKEIGENLLAENHNVILLNYQPTCENMLLDFKEKIQNNLPNHIKLAKLILYETETSYAEWLAN